MVHHDWLDFADHVLSRPPSQHHIYRPPGIGELVSRFVLPLSLCQTTNATRHGQPWRLGKAKREIGEQMRIQEYTQHHRACRETPLPGRPMVRCVRFSSMEPDKYADWAKAAVDRLTVAGGLGYLRDDRPRDVDLHQWWEPAPRGHGFVLIEIWTGVES